jgi:hypothetical protein
MTLRSGTMSPSQRTDQQAEETNRFGNGRKVKPGPPARPRPRQWALITIAHCGQRLLLNYTTAMKMAMVCLILTMELVRVLRAAIVNTR